MQQTIQIKAKYIAAAAQFIDRKGIERLRGFRIDGGHFVATDGKRLFCAAGSILYNGDGDKRMAHVTFDLPKDVIKKCGLVGFRELYVTLTIMSTAAHPNQIRGDVINVNYRSSDGSGPDGAAFLPRDQKYAH